MWAALKKLIACVLVAALILPVGTAKAGPEKTSSAQAPPPRAASKKPLLLAEADEAPIRRSGGQSGRSVSPAPPKKTAPPAPSKKPQVSEEASEETAPIRKGSSTRSSGGGGGGGGFPDISGMNGEAALIILAVIIVIIVVVTITEQISKKQSKQYSEKAGPESAQRQRPGGPAGPGSEEAPAYSLGYVPPDGGNVRAASAPETEKTPGWWPFGQRRAPNAPEERPKNPVANAPAERGLHRGLKAPSWWPFGKQRAENAPVERPQNPAAYTPEPWPKNPAANAPAERRLNRGLQAPSWWPFGKPRAENAPVERPEGAARPTWDPGNTGFGRAYVPENGKAANAPEQEKRPGKSQMQNLLNDLAVGFSGAFRGLGQPRAENAPKQRAGGPAAGPGWSSDNARPGLSRGYAPENGKAGNAPEQRPPEQRLPAQRPPEQRPPEQRPPEQRPGKSQMQNLLNDLAVGFSDAFRGLGQPGAENAKQRPGGPAGQGWGSENAQDGYSREYVPPAK